MLAPAALDDITYQISPCRSAVPQGVDERQCRLALGEIVAEVLTASLGIGLVIQNVVDELIGGTQMTAESRERSLLRLACPAEHGRDFGACLK